MPHTHDLVLLEEEELDERLSDSRRELFNLRFQLATGQLDNPARVRHVRREVARILTVLREREIAEAEGTYVAPSAAEHEAARARLAAEDEAEAAAAEAAARARRGEEETDEAEEGDLDVADDVDAEAHDDVDDLDDEDVDADDEDEPTDEPEEDA
jgi:large subunit ribosomal protein L29